MRLHTDWGCTDTERVLTKKLTLGEKSLAAPGTQTPIAWFFSRTLYPLSYPGPVPLALGAIVGDPKEVSWETQQQRQLERKVQVTLQTYIEFRPVYWLASSSREEARQASSCCWDWPCLGFVLYPILSLCPDLYHPTLSPAFDCSAHGAYRVSPVLLAWQTAFLPLCCLAVTKVAVVSLG